MIHSYGVRRERAIHAFSDVRGAGAASPPVLVIHARQRSVTFSTSLSPRVYTIHTRRLKKDKKKHKLPILFFVLIVSFHLGGFFSKPLNRQLTSEQYERVWTAATVSHPPRYHRTTAQAPTTYTRTRDMYKMVRMHNFRGSARATINCPYVSGRERIRGNLCTNTSSLAV